jgi:zinc/manganese transport system substrate-binding protein
MFSKAIFSIAIFCNIAHAAQVVTTLPELAWVVKKLDPSLTVSSLLEGTEDPHFVDASPGFIFKAAKSEILVFNGLELEVGWLPKVIEMSGNKDIQVGESGYCDASKTVSKLGKLETYDRSMGDVHPEGNPHYTLSPKRMLEAAKGIKKCLEKISKKPLLEKNFKGLEKELILLDKEFKSYQLKDKFFVYHTELEYLEKDYGLVFRGALEKVPGVLPSAGYLTQMAIQAKKDQPRYVLAGATSPRKILDKFKEMSGVDYIMLALHPKRNESYTDFVKNLMEKIKSGK